jgi:hypothetical protein
MSDIKKEKNTKRPRRDSDMASAAPALIVRLYAVESCYGEEPMYILYKSPNPARSQRVHTALKSLLEKEAETGLPVTWGLFYALMEQKSLADRAKMDNVLSMGALYRENVNTQAKDLVHAAYMTIGDEDRETDAFESLGSDDGVSYEDQPIVSFLRFCWNA